MQQHLQENICRLDGRPSNDDISFSTIEEHIHEGLAYACTYWASHITVDDDMTEDLYCALHQFFASKILQWVECLNHLGQLDVAIDALRRIESWAQVCRSRCIHDYLFNVFIRLVPTCRLQRSMLVDSSRRTLISSRKTA
jgi:hypothetical protein